MEKSKKRDYHLAIKNAVQQLKSKRCELQEEISFDEMERAEVVGEMNKLQDKLSILDANLKKKSEFRKEYDRAINQSEENFVEWLKKSEDFLSLTQREVLALSHIVCDVPGTCKNSKECHREHKLRSDELQAQSYGPAAIFSFEGPSTIGPGPVNSAAPNGCSTMMIPFRANGL